MTWYGDQGLQAARMRFWELCCAATKPVYSDEELGRLPSNLTPEQKALAIAETFRMEASVSARVADDKLAEWDRRWGKDGVAP